MEELSQIRNFLSDLEKAGAFVVRPVRLVDEILFRLKAWRTPLSDRRNMACVVTQYLQGVRTFLSSGKKIGKDAAFYGKLFEVVVSAIGRELESLERKNAEHPSGMKVRVR
jgi:hypothetical protein